MANTSGWATLGELAAESSGRQDEKRLSDRARIMQQASSSMYGLQQKLAQVADDRQSSLKELMAAARKKNAQKQQVVQQQHVQEQSTTPQTDGAAHLEKKEDDGAAVPTPRASFSQQQAVTVSPMNASDAALPFRRRSSARPTQDQETKVSSQASLVSEPERKLDQDRVIEINRLEVIMNEKAAGLERNVPESSERVASSTDTIAQELKLQAELDLLQTKASEQSIEAKQEILSHEAPIRRDSLVQRKSSVSVRRESTQKIDELPRRDSVAQGNESMAARRESAVQNVEKPSSSGSLTQRKDSIAMQRKDSVSDTRASLAQKTDDNLPKRDSLTPKENIAERRESFTQPNNSDATETQQQSERRATVVRRGQLSMIPPHLRNRQATVNDEPSPKPAATSEIGHVVDNHDEPVSSLASSAIYAADAQVQEKRGSVILVHERPSTSNVSEPVEKRGSMVFMGPDGILVEATFTEEILGDEELHMTAVAEYTEGGKIRRTSSAARADGNATTEVSSVANAVELPEQQSEIPLVVRTSRRFKKVSTALGSHQNRSDSICSVVAVIAADLDDEEDGIATAEVEHTEEVLSDHIIRPSPSGLPPPSPMDHRAEVFFNPKESDALPPLARRQSQDQSPNPGNKRRSSLFGVLRRLSGAVVAAPEEAAVVVASSPSNASRQTSSVSSMTLESQSQPQESPLVVYRNPSLAEFASGGSRRNSTNRALSSKSELEASKEEGMTIKGEVGAIPSDLPKPPRRQSQSAKDQQQVHANPDEDNAKRSSQKVSKQSQEILKRVQNLSAKIAELTSLESELAKIEKEQLDTKDATLAALEETLKEQEEVEAQIEILKIRRKALQLKAGELDETLEKQSQTASRTTEERKLAQLAAEKAEQEKDELLQEYASLQQQHPERVKPISSKELVSEEVLPAKNRRLTFPIPGQSPVPAPPLVLRGLFQLKKDAAIDKVPGPSRVSETTKQALLRVPSPRAGQESPRAAGLSINSSSTPRDEGLPRPGSKHVSMMNELQGGVHLKKVEKGTIEVSSPSQLAKPTGVMGRLARSLSVRREAMENSDDEDAQEWDD